ncbi:MAG: histidinol-phosphate transaminase [Acidiferrobacterales bacterium]
MSIENRIQRLIRPEVRALQAYGVADPGDLIKLDAMENPYGWPEPVKREWAEMLVGIDINRYPDAGADELRQLLHDYMGVPKTMGQMLGNGSDELIQIILMALATNGAKVLAPVPTFVMYAMTAQFVGMEFVGVPLNGEDFSLDREAMLDAISEHDPAVIFLAYPNNPTGNLFDRSTMEAILEESNGLVVVDEAYHAFAGRSFMNELEKYENLLVMRTVSKLGLAGLRLGLLAGDRHWLNEFNKVRLPYNINSLTQASARFVLQQDQFLQQQTANIVRERGRLLEALKELTGIDLWPSYANFILFRTVQKDAGEIFEGLKRAGILIKKLDGSHPLLKNCLRVTVGLPEENDAFLKALASLL